MDIQPSTVIPGTLYCFLGGGALLSSVQLRLIFTPLCPLTFAAIIHDKKSLFGCVLQAKVPQGVHVRGNNINVSRLKSNITYQGLTFG